MRIGIDARLLLADTPRGTAMSPLKLGRPKHAWDGHEADGSEARNAQGVNYIGNDPTVFRELR